LETKYYKNIKKSGAYLNAKSKVGKSTGCTEAWSKSTFPIKSIKELKRLNEEFEEII